MASEVRCIWGCHSEPHSGLTHGQAGIWGQVPGSGKGCGAGVAGVGGEGGRLSLRGVKGQPHTSPSGAEGVLEWVWGPLLGGCLNVGWTRD